VELARGIVFHQWCGKNLQSFKGENLAAFLTHPVNIIKEIITCALIDEKISIIKEEKK